jgi:fructosamine-3-kinase
MRSSGDSEALAAAASILGTRRVAIERVFGGQNNQLFRVSAGARSFALKSYLTRPNDPRDRFAVETQAIAFLRGQRCQSVPELIGANAAARVAVYEWVEGEPVDEIVAADIGEVVDFTEILHLLRRASGARELPLASEACLSGTEILTQLDRRLGRLRFVAELDAALRHL